jgi:hypothetical protein
VKDAIYFVSQPLVREYVDEQRLIKSTYAELLRRKQSDLPDKYAAASNVISKHWELPKTLNKGRARYDEAVRLSKKHFKGEEEFSTEEMYDLIKDYKKDPKAADSDLSKLMFMHYLQIEAQIEGITQLKMNSNPDTSTDNALFKSEVTLANLESLETESKLDQDLFKDMLSDSIISSFFNQKMALGVSKPLFPLRYHPAISSFLIYLSKTRQLRKDSATTFGEGNEDVLVATFRNDFISYILQNSLRKYKLSDGYKGYEMTDVVPLKMVDHLKFGAHVGLDNGKKVLYVDKVKLRNEFESNAWVEGSDNANSYEKRKLFPLKAGHFMTNKFTNFDEYTRFVAEREFLRDLYPISEYKNTEDFENELVMTKVQKPNMDETEQNRFTYEKFLAHRALENTFNPYHMFKDPNYSFASEYSKILKKYNNLPKEYTVLQRIKVDANDSRTMFNLYLSDKDVNNSKANLYHADLIKLADPNVEKVDNKEDNKMISDFFTRMSMVAFLQTGLNKSKFSFTNIVDFDEFLSVMQQEGQKFVNLLNDSESAEEIITNYYFDIFLNENKFMKGGKPNKDRNRFKNLISKLNFDNLKKVKTQTVQLSTSVKGFQGYKGGFENTGKGTPKGDGKDKAMRQVADGFIGEISKQSESSTLTSAIEVLNVESYQDIIGAVNFSQSKVAIVPAMKNQNATVIMLARNGGRSGKDLSNEVKNAILDAKNKDVEFVVGDMPNVDSQFIDYLQEIGAKFTIYHTGATSRIQVEQTNQSSTTPSQVGQIKQLKELDPRYDKYSDEQIQGFIDSVFPDSEVKDIVYHGTNDKNFDPKKNEQGIHFGFKKYVEEWMYKTNAPGNQKYYEIEKELEDLEEGEYSETFNATREELEEQFEYLKNRKTYYFPALLNIENPKKTTYKAYNWEDDIKNAEKTNNDGLIYDINKDVVNDNFLEGQNQVVFEPSQIFILNSDKAHKQIEKFVSTQPSTSVKIEPTDKIIFGHPTIGKSYLKKQGEDKFITLDDDYANEVNSFVDANRGSETRQEYKGRKPKEYNEFMLNLYDRLKVQAQKEGKILFVSNTNILKERMSDFDKVITIPKVEFKRRFDERGATYGFEDWKSEIDAAIAKVPANKVITTTGYLSDLLPTQSSTSVRKNIKSSKETTLQYLSQEGVAIFKNNTGKPDHYQNLVNVNSDVVFVANEVVAAIADPSKFFLGESSLVRAAEGMVIKMPTSQLKINDNFQGFTDETFPKIIERFEKRIELIKNILYTSTGEWTGEVVAFSDNGYGDPSKMPQKLFVYLSRRLYEEFGYLNPGSEHYDEISQMVVAQQGIDDQMIIDKFDNETSDPFKC